MAKVSTGKLKMLYIMDALQKQTDEKKRLSTSDLISMLHDKGIKAERKSIYDDIETLKEFGFDIMYDKEEPSGYYFVDREFELPELKLLVDAVQSSKFITARKSASLIKKLEKLASENEAKQLQRQVFVTNRVKAMNESIYYNVDAVHYAIQNNNQIRFGYMQWNLEKKLEPRNNGEDIVTSPWALTWDDENYYMLGYDAAAGIVKHYRVDKMRSITQLHVKREGEKIFDSFDVAQFATRTFGMFGGETQKVTLECDNQLIGAIIDRFGTDVIIVPSGNDKFKITHDITVSGQFFGWLVGLGAGIRIIYPQSVADQFQLRIHSMIQEK